MKSISISPPNNPLLSNDEKKKEVESTSIPQVAQDPQSNEENQDSSKEVEQEQSAVVPQSKEGTTTYKQQEKVPQFEESTTQASYNAQLE